MSLIIWIYYEINGVFETNLIIGYIVKQFEYF